MMNKIIAFAVALTIAVIALCGIATAEEYFPLLTVVFTVETVEPNLWEITCMDKDGNVFSFLEDIEPWRVGDIANLLMVDPCGVWELCEIVDVWYEGHLSLDQTAIWITH